MRRGFRIALPNGLVGDPLVVVRVPWLPRLLLLDAGDAAGLTPRMLLDAGDVLITHAHVDHVFGLGRLLRVRLGRPERPLRLFGPPGLAGQVRSHLGGYAWNLVSAFPLDLTVVEIHRDRTETWRFPTSAGFEPYVVGRGPAPGEAAVLADELLEVRATTLAHGDIPSIAYRVEERRGLQVDPVAIEGLGLTPGPWLGALKAAVRRGAPDDEPLALPDGRALSIGELRGRLLHVAEGDALAYASDVAPDEANLTAIVELARGARRLVIEAHYLDADLELARRNAHLTAGLAGRIAREAGVDAVVPLHVSPRYEERVEEVLAELAAHARPAEVELG
ncbi:MAG: MBL fold metallo-hydrolase [Acidobacteria bacterium]|jgi:ribonuclease Z|nr:MBL fold metallo-hydrolase [Acidobacteriota bacterium]